MWNCFFGILLTVGLLASAQERTIVVVPSTPPSRGDIAVPRMEKGVVEGRTYKNASIGLELTPAAGLAFDTPTLKGNPGTVPLLVTVAAWGEINWSSPRRGTIFYAEALASYPSGQRSTGAYVRKVIRGNGQEGFEVVEQNQSANLGGVSFARIDFKRDPVYEAVLVKSCDTQVLVFIFAASARDAVADC